MSSEAVLSAPRAPRLSALPAPDVAPPLTFCLLGGFSLRRGGEPVADEEWERPMAQRVVRLLLVHRGAAVPEDVLFEALWPGRVPGGARRSLQVAVSRARTVLDRHRERPTAIEAGDRTYRVRLREDDVVDVDGFVSAAAAALGQTGAGRADALERAALLWTGEPLPEDRYAEWALGWREDLMDRMAEVLAALGDAHLAAGRALPAVRALRRLVALDELNEDAHRRLIRALARAGRRDRALRQFLDCRRALVDGLGVEPDERTLALQRRVLAGEAL